MEIVCSKCESTLDSRRVKLGLKDCIGCSEVKKYSGHIVYPHKTGAYLQPVSSEQSNNRRRLDRRSNSGKSRPAKGIFKDNSWDRWLERYYDNIYSKQETKIPYKKIRKIFSHMDNQSLYQQVIHEYLNFGYYQAQEKINKLYSQDKISLTQKSKMMNNLSSFQMMTKKQKSLLNLNTKENNNE